MGASGCPLLLGKTAVCAQNVVGLLAELHNWMIFATLIGQDHWLGSLFGWTPQLLINLEGSPWRRERRVPPVLASQALALHSEMPPWGPKRWEKHSAARRRSFRWPPHSRLVTCQPAGFHGALAIRSGAD